MSARPRVALVDGSAFYVACERVFDPCLVGVPVAVLSNNDGCVVARSDEVKAAGVAMGAPYFKVRGTLAGLGAVVLSSNYTLYGDMSRRVMETLGTVSAGVAPYSVDEAFVGVPPGDPLVWAQEARARVLRWTGIPVRVSVGETKTLAKAASELARAQIARGGEPVAVLTGEPERSAWLARLDVGDVWGVGRRWSARLGALGVTTAAGLAAMPEAVVRQRFGVVLARTAAELRGVACVREDDTPVRQTLVRSRSFGDRVFERSSVEQAVATHAARACEKLRAEGLVAGHVAAFVTTKGYGEGPHHSGWEGVMLDVATARTPEVIRAALACLRRCYVVRDCRGQAVGYRKAGVVLSEIRPAGSEQRSLFAAETCPEQEAAQGRLMASVDALNRRFGTRAVVFGSMGADRSRSAPVALRKTRDGSEGAPQWEMRRERMTPLYTTRWDELPVVRL